MNLSKNHFALLPALYILLKHKNITHAASQLHISQSAMSKIFAQLRDSFADPLLIRAGKQYHLSQRGEQLLLELENLIPQTQRLWQAPKLNLATEDRFIHIAGTDMDIDYLSNNIDSIIQQAPNAGVSVTTSDEQSLDALREGTVDFVMSAFDSKQTYFERAQIIHSDYLVISKSTLDIKQMDLDTYLNLPHVAFQLSGAKKSAVDIKLEQQKRQRKIILWTPTFYHAIKTVTSASTDCLLTLPRAFAERAKVDNQIAYHPLPVALNPIRVYLYWHKKINSDPFLHWAKTQLLSK